MAAIITLMPSRSLCFHPLSAFFHAIPSGSLFLSIDFKWYQLLIYMVSPTNSLQCTGAKKPQASVVPCIIRQIYRGMLAPVEVALEACYCGGDPDCDHGLGKVWMCPFCHSPLLDKAISAALEEKNMHSSRATDAMGLMCTVYRRKNLAFWRRNGNVIHLCEPPLQTFHL